MTFEEYKEKTHEIINEVNDLCNTYAMAYDGWTKDQVLQHFWEFIRKVEDAAVYPEGVGNEGVGNEQAL